MPSERTEYERKYITWLGLPEQRRRNVDKQRRRLLAEKFSETADFYSSHAYTIRLDCLTALADEERAKWFERHAAKLRTIAARLRGTK